MNKVIEKMTVYDTGWAERVELVLEDNTYIKVDMTDAAFQSVKEVDEFSKLVKGMIKDAQI